MKLNSSQERKSNGRMLYFTVCVRDVNNDIKPYGLIIKKTVF